METLHRQQLALGFLVCSRAEDGNNPAITAALSVKTLSLQGTCFLTGLDFLDHNTVVH